jgi:hypothetical protein
MAYEGRICPNVAFSNPRGCLERPSATERLLLCRAVDASADDPEMEWLGELKWGRFFMVIVGTGLGSAVVQALFPIYRERRLRGKQAVYT